MLSRLFKVEEIVIELHAIQVSCQGLTRGRGVLTRSAAFLSLFPFGLFQFDNSCCPVNPKFSIVICPGLLQGGPSSHVLNQVGQVPPTPQRK